MLLFAKWYYILMRYLAGRSVDGFLGGRDGVHRSHEAFDDLEVVVNYLGERRQAVGGAGGVGDYFAAGIVSFQVHTDDEHRRIGRRSGDDDFLGTAFQVSLRREEI